MPLEAEVRVLVLIGYIIVCAIVYIPIFIVWKRTKDTGLLFFLPQLLFLTLSMYAFYSLLRSKGDMPEIFHSEFNSLSIGAMGLFWAISMFLMLAGILTVHSTYKNRNKSS